MIRIITEKKDSIKRTFFSTEDLVAGRYTRVYF